MRGHAHQEIRILLEQLDQWLAAGRERAQVAQAVCKRYAHGVTTWTATNVRYPHT
jgi:hypothetical protein